MRGGETIYIAFDLSLRETGWCRYDTITKKLESGVLKPKQMDVERLIWYQSEFRYLLSMVDLIGVEGFSFASPNQAHQIGELHGIFKVVCHSFAHLWIYAPTQIKKFASGKGNSKKDEMLLRVYTKWGFETNNHNVADAYAVLRLLMAHHETTSGINVNLLSYEHEVIENILHPKPKKKKGRKGDL